MKKPYRQYNLTSNDSHTTAWLEEGLKVGNRVTLKDSMEPERWWTVTSMGDTRMLKEELHKKSKWNNNI